MGRVLTLGQVLTSEASAADQAFISSETLGRRGRLGEAVRNCVEESALTAFLPESNRVLVALSALLRLLAFIG
jgi:hypothetical protein